MNGSRKKKKIRKRKEVMILVSISACLRLLLVILVKLSIGIINFCLQGVGQFHNGLRKEKKEKDEHISDRFIVTGRSFVKHFRKSVRHLA